MSNKYFSACIHDSNKIPTTTPVFPGSSDTVRLVQLLSDVWVTVKSKIVPTNRMYKYRYVYLRSYVYDSAIP